MTKQSARIECLTQDLKKATDENMELKKQLIERKMGENSNKGLLLDL